jgi:cob(I)alamin adenosyltransferase
MEDKDTTRELDNPQEEKKIKKAVNDISTDLSSLCVDVKSISGQLPSLVVTREEVNTFKLRIEKYDKELEQAVKTIKKGVDVRVSPAVLSEAHVGMLDQIKTNLEARNKRWSTLCRAIASTGKVKVVFTAVISALITAAFMLLAYENSPHVWAHRALVAAEESHLEDPAGEYSKAFVEMQGHRKERKACKERIEGMEYEAKYIRRLEGILSGYTEEELEVRKYIVNIKDEQLVLLVCYHHSTDQMINYRMHTTPEGIVTKVEIEKKVKGKKVWEELKQLTGE